MLSLKAATAVVIMRNETFADPSYLALQQELCRGLNFGDTPFSKPLSSSRCVSSSGQIAPRFKRLALTQGWGITTRSARIEHWAGRSAEEVKAGYSAPSTAKVWGTHT